jgi:hypothetical protein
MRIPARWSLWLSLLIGTLAARPIPVVAQTDFYNLDRERPLRVEDAYATKRWAFEAQAEPLRLTQLRSGALRFAPSIEFKHGILPGVEASVGGGFEHVREGGDSETRFADLELSTLLNLWIEGSRLPAAGIRLTAAVPGDGDASSTLEVRGVLTRTLRGAVRGHLNAAALVGHDAPERWWIGGALDYALPFHHTLLLVETWGSKPRGEGITNVHSAAGIRYQLSPTFSIDAGVGRSWQGENREDWNLTLGVTHEFGVRALMPGVE